MTELSLGMPLLGTVLFMGHVFLKRAWHICFAWYLLLMVGYLIICMGYQVHPSC